MPNKPIALFLFSLIFFKLIAIYYTNFSLYGDEAQYWLWSQELDFGYYSKPPLLAWFLNLYANIFGSSFISLKIFPIIVYFFISLGVYFLCLSLSFNKKNSWLCAASFMIIPAASLSSFLISTDLLLLLFWLMSMIVLLNIIRANHTFSFVLLGLFLGLAFLAKYAAIYFFLGLFLLLLVDKKTLSSFKGNPAGVVAFLFSFLLVLAPNIWWNFNNGWITVSHTTDNANLQNLNLNFYEPFKFLGAQIVMVSPFLFISFVYFLKNFRLDFENKFLLIFSFPILFIVLLESFLVRANANWAAPALISVFILMFRMVVSKKLSLIKINFVFNYFIALVLFSLILISSNNSVFKRISQVDSFVIELLEIIKDKDLVISDRLIFSSISYEMRQNPNNIYMPYKTNTDITNHFQMSAPLKKNRKDGFFLIGSLDDVSYLTKKHRGELIKNFNVPFSSQKLKLYEITFK